MMSSEQQEAAFQSSPLIRQYLEIKGRYPEAILFFRVGDFYEMFFDDALIASRILQITLTSRDKEAKDPVPLCGVPYHAARAYIAKLIAAGRSVALCEQMEIAAARTSPKIIRREVVRIITPGTLIEPDLLAPKEPNYLAALVFSGPQKPSVVGLAYLDLSTGDFRTLEQESGDAALDAKIAALSAREILLSEHLLSNLSSLPLSLARERLKGFRANAFDPHRARATLCEHFQVGALAGLGCAETPWAASAAGALLAYVQETQKVALANITRLRTVLADGHLLMNSSTQRHLDLVGRPDKSPGLGLFGVIDETKTAMGGRLLREWLLHPLLEREKILMRQEAIEAFLSELPRRRALTSRLEAMGDLERLIGRIGLLQAQPRDLAALKESLQLLPELRAELSDFSAELIHHTRSDWDDLGDVAQRIRRTLVDDPPALLKEGGVIREGHCLPLDELRAIRRDGRSWLARLESEERSRTRIDSLKIRYNQVFGYYIEISRPNLSKTPPTYQRKQTLANAERFTTPELIELEGKILGAEEKISLLEAECFEILRQEIVRETRRIQQMAQKIAELDVLLSLASVAERGGYCRPEIGDGDLIWIKDGRHPILERVIPPGSFVPNDTQLGADRPMVILTGPNMAGKSTYMRQIALIVLLAQMGSYVPAREAHIGIVDRIFTRVGAQDDIVSGQSTFMVEMNEMAGILHHTTSKSLLLLDEIGRGTSTYDGVSIAWAIAEYIQAHLAARTLFATHYHELTALPEAHPGIRNANVAVREWNDEVIFLRKIAEGGCDKSYGIQVARLAGLPSEVIDRAKEILAGLESGDPPLSANRPAPPLDQASLFSEPPKTLPTTSPVLDAIRALDPDRMTPLEALIRLTELKRMAAD